MDIIGVNHKISFKRVDDFLLDQYPDGIESMLLEINENWDDICSYVSADFFVCLAQRQKRRGTKIIYGDLPLQIPDYIRNTGDNLAFALLQLYRGFFNWGKRNANLEKHARKSNPQVVIVGANHADYLKSKFPDEKYTRLSKRFFDGYYLNKIGTFFLPHPRADEVHYL